MQQITVNKISVDDVWEMLWKGWELARVNYVLSIALIIILTIVLGGLSAIPMVGPFIVSFIAVLLPFPYLVLCRKWENNDPGSFDDAINALKDPKTIEHMKPLLLLNLGLSLVNAILPSIPVLGSLFWMFQLVSMPVSVLITMAYPILFYNRQLKWTEAMQLAVDGLSKNVIPFLVNMVLIIIFVSLCFILLVLPVFLVAIPTVVTLQYLWYRLVYEDLKFEIKDEGII